MSLSVIELTALCELMLLAMLAHRHATTTEPLEAREDYESQDEA
jgi:hypothetical protein